MVNAIEPVNGSRRQSGFFGVIERIGNRLPDPIMIFVWLILLLMILSAMGSYSNWSVSIAYPGNIAPQGGVLENGEVVFRAVSLFSEANIARLFTEMPRTLTNFSPLGLVLLVMFGAGVAERVGFFSALLRVSLRNVPAVMLTPLVSMIGMVSHHAADAAYIVFIPLAALLYASVGRHPLAGLAAAFASVSGGYVGNITPGQIDVLLFGFTEEAAQIIDPAWTMNPLGNWYFILAVVFLFTPIIWFVTDFMIEPRLGKWIGSDDVSLKAELAKSAVTPLEKKGLGWAAIAAFLVIGLFAVLSCWPGYTPFIDEMREGPAAFEPFYRALITGFFLLFLLCGIVFGIAVGLVKQAKDIIDHMIDATRSMAPYIVFALFAAHFLAMFNWSNLGPIAAINGSQLLKAIGLPTPLLLVSVLLFSSFLDLFIGSASAKWSALSPVVVPMFMLLGISPEMTQAAYRVGDSFTNIMTPLMSYFPLILGFARRWDSSFGVGSLLSLMLPFALSFAVAGILMTIGWVYFDLPLGPDATVKYMLPAVAS